MTRDVCGGCGQQALEVVLDLGRTPLADRFPATAGEAETSYPLRLALCRACWLLQLLDVVPDRELWDGEYAFMTGASPSSIAYFREWAAWAQARFDTARLTVEIACNDGTLLRHFRGPVLGVEPAAGPAQAARAAGLSVRQALFTEAEAKDIRAAHGPAALVIACNVAAHAADPLDFLRGVRQLLADDGAAVVEFQDAAELIAGCQFDHVYHEHRFYYSLDTFAELAARADLAVADYERTAAQGGSLRVILKPGRLPLLTPVSEPWLRYIFLYDSLWPRAEHVRVRLRRALRAERLAGRVVAGYGATAKSCTLLNWCDIGRDELAYIEDLTPGKIGRYTPGTKIPVVRRGTIPPDTYLLLAWNYAAQILRRNRDFGGRWIIPFTGAVL